MFTVTVRSSKKLVANLQSVDEALIAESAGFLVEAHGRNDVQRLAEARIAASPDYNVGPTRGQEYVMFTSAAGRKILCEIVRLTHPDNEGYPQLLELLNPGRPDTSFMARAESCEVVDQDKISIELLRVLQNGDLEVMEPKTPRLQHGLRK